MGADRLRLLSTLLAGGLITTSRLQLAGGVSTAALGAFRGVSLRAAA
jgi:hypothetical protein